MALAAVIDDIAALDAEPFTLGGYSMGGRIALHVALALPERVERLVLIGASPGIADPAQRRARREPTSAWPTRMEAMTIEEFAAGVGADAGARGSAAGRRRGRPRGPAAQHARGPGAALRGLGTGALPSLWERLGQLAMPVTLIVGERDREVPHGRGADGGAIAGAE